MTSAKRKADALPASLGHGPEVSTDDEQCDFCHKPGAISYPGSFFVLPCGHTLCSSCLSTCLCERGSAPYLECPAINCCAGSKITSYEGHFSRRVTNTVSSRSGSARETTSTIAIDPPRTFTIRPPSIKESPHYHHAQLCSSQLRAQDVHITCTFGDPNDPTRATKTIASSMKNVGFGTEHQEAASSDADKDKLEKIFQLVHTLVDWNSYGDNTHGSGIEVLAQDQDCPVYAVDRSLAHRLVHALGSGTLLKDDMAKAENPDTEDRRSWKKKVNMSAAATDLSRKHTFLQTKETALQKLLDEQFLIHGVPQAVLDLAHLFGLASSRHTSKSKGRKMAKEVLARGWDPERKKWDVILVVFDNLGFKTLGGKKLTFDQYTTIQIITIPKEDLVKWGIYPDPKSNIPIEDQQLVSRETTVWTEATRSMVDAETDLMAYTDEYSRFARNTLQSWDNTMRNVNNAPFLHDCINYCESGAPIDMSGVDVDDVDDVDKCSSQESADRASYDDTGKVHSTVDVQLCATCTCTKCKFNNMKAKSLRFINIKSHAGCTRPDCTTTSHFDDVEANGMLTAHEADESAELIAHETDSDSMEKVVKSESDEVQTSRELEERDKK